MVHAQAFKALLPVVQSEGLCKPLANLWPVSTSGLRIDHSLLQDATPIARRLPPVVQSEGLCDPLAKIEMPLVRVLAEMEHTRIAVNVEALALQK